MIGQNGGPMLRRLAVAAAALSTVLALGGTVTACDPNVGSTPELTTTEEGTNSPEDSSGLQPTNSFGYIPEHESPLPTGENGPGVPGPGGGNPFDNPGPPLPGGPELPARANIQPTLTTPAG